jgi:hypothetical protein
MGRAAGGRLMIFAAVAVLHGSPLNAQSVTQIRDNGPRANRLNVVFISEGYTAEELPTKFLADAEKIADRLLATEPYARYANFFNAFAIAVASAESGSDHPSLGIYRNTYFNSSFDSHGLGHALTIPPNNYIASYAEGQGKVDRLLMQFVPDYDLAIVLVNDPRHGGTASARTSIVSMSDTAGDVAVHETGHSLADLADEYESAGPANAVIAEKANATQQTQRGSIKWSSWISPETPIPTPETINGNTGRPFYEREVGLFEGANYNASGWYRPKFDCRMRTSSTPFCEVCTEALVLHVYGRISAIDSATPQERSLMLYSGESKTLAITRLRPVTHDLQAQWFIDGEPVAGATGDQLLVSAQSLSPGQHTVRVDVWDPTPLVRNHWIKTMTQSKEWTVTINDTPPPTSAPVLNISTRLQVESGEGVLIGGFILTGNAPKRVLIRAIGPSLGPGLGIPSAALDAVLRDPVLELIDGSGSFMGLNDNWRDTHEQEIRATGIPPTHGLESAMIATLAPGAYTAKVAGKDGTPGVGLVEVYDLQQNSTAKLANISTRGSVRAGDNVMIGGFIIGSAGPGKTKVVLRAIGLSLANAGVAGPLQDPTLELRDGNGELLSRNDNWKDEQQGEIAGSGLAPTDERESALAATLPSGAYTAIVAGKNGTIGVGLFELYDLGQ